MARKESENVALIDENAFIERKHRSQRRKSFCRAKSSLAKAKMCLPSQNVSHKAITGLPSEDVPRKGENTLTERKRSTKRQNRMYVAKMSFAKAFKERFRSFAFATDVFKTVLACMAIFSFCEERIRSINTFLP